jgi:uncharacterized delta-60 repeat protein
MKQASKSFYAILLILWIFFPILIYPFSVTDSNNNHEVEGILSLNANNDNSESWIRIWSGPRIDWCEDAIIDSNNNIYLTGHTELVSPYTDSLVLLKYNTSGNLKFNVNWEGLDYSHGYGLALDNDENIYIIGNTRRISGDDSDVVVIKYNSFGECQWNFTWGGNQTDTGYALTVDSLGNIYATGITESYGEGDADIFIAKFNSSQELVWNTMWGGSLEDIALDLKLDNSNNTYIVGGTQSFGNNYFNLLVVKFNTLGIQQWNRTWEGGNFAYGLALDNSNSIYVSGVTSNYGSGSEDVVLAKFDTLGNLQWNRTWGKSNQDVATDIILDIENNIYVTGFTNSFSGDQEEIFILNYDNNGTKEYSKIWGKYEANYLTTSIQLDVYDNIYIAGTVLPPEGYSDIFLIKNPITESKEIISGFNYSLLIFVVLGLSTILLIKYLPLLKKNK